MMTGSCSAGIILISQFNINIENFRIANDRSSYIFTLEDKNNNRKVLT
jgi:hypothetical protein